MGIQRSRDPPQARGFGCCLQSRRPARSSRDLQRRRQLHGEERPAPGHRSDRKAFRETHFLGGTPKQQLRFEQLAVRRLATDVALATARFALSGAEEPDQTGCFTLVWARMPAGWRALHDHSS
jgi:hypothetical protein